MPLGCPSARRGQVLSVIFQNGTYGHLAPGHPCDTYRCLAPGHPSECHFIITTTDKHFTVVTDDKYVHMLITPHCSQVHAGADQLSLESNWLISRCYPNMLSYEVCSTRLTSLWITSNSIVRNYIQHHGGLPTQYIV